MYAIFNANGQATKKRFDHVADAEFQLRYEPKGSYVDSVYLIDKNDKNKWKLSID